MSTPFTQEQIEWLAERDAELDRRRREWIDERESRLKEHGTDWSRRHIRAYTRRATIGFLILLAGVGGAFYTQGKDRKESNRAIVQSGRVISVSGCNRDYVTVNRLRNVLKRSLDFQRAALQRGDITLDQFSRAQEYFVEQLDGLPQVDCRPSASLITDNPEDLPDIPKPLHPPDPPHLPYGGPH